TTVWKRVILTGQVRQDWVAGNTPTTWRIGSVVRVPEINTSFKAAYGTSFRAPSLFERFGVDSSGTVGNPALKPESSQGWEAGFTTKFPVAGHDDALTIGVTYFNQRTSDLIANVFLPNGAFSWINVNAA